MRSAPRPQRLLFGIAAAWAMVSVPVVVLQMNAGAAIFAGPGGLFHAREMFLGFLLPIMAGYLRPRLDRRWLLVLVVTWLAGRGSAFAGPDAWRVGADLALAAVFVGAVTPALFRGAKKWRNRALPVLLVCLVLLAGVLLTAGLLEPKTYRVVLPTLATAVSLLLLFMGGRILVPLYRGHAKRQGLPRAPGLQPRLEGFLIVLCAGCALLLTLDRPAEAGGMAIVAGILAAARIVRWRPWRHADRPELLALLAGQVWTVVALCLFGITWANGRPVSTSSMHVLTIGGVGTMTAMVMSLTMLRGSRVARVWLPLVGILMAGSLGFRVAANLQYPGRDSSLLISAFLWSLIWAGVLLLAIRGVSGRR